MSNLMIDGPAYDKAAKDGVKDNNSVAIDVGSNVGLKAELFCSLGYNQVHLFEPSPRMLNSSKKLLDKYSNKCVFNQKGLSDYKRELKNIKLLQSWILCGDDESYNYPISPGAVELQPELFDTVLITLDEYCSDFTRLDLLKIDVEGYEFKVFRGGQNTIKKFKPIIILELSLYIKDIEKNDIIHFINYIYTLEYEVFDLQGKPVSRERMIAEYPYHSSCDVVMYPTQK